MKVHKETVKRLKNLLATITATIKIKAGDRNRALVENIIRDKK